MPSITLSEGRADVATSKEARAFERMCSSERTESAKVARNQPRLDAQTVIHTSSLTIHAALPMVDQTIHGGWVPSARPVIAKSTTARMAEKETMNLRRSWQTSKKTPRQSLTIFDCAS
jgi:hypothetical protein